MTARFEAMMVALKGAGPRRIIEIGCGNGAFAARLGTAHPKLRYVGIDRSASAIARAKVHNAAMVERGRMAFHHADLHDYREAEPFDLCCAINVNVFWTKGPPAFAAASALLGARGDLILAFEAPGAARSAEIAAKMARTVDGAFQLDGIERHDPRLFVAHYRFARNGS